ncbi:SDR family oxidoreductase [Bosea psychrotolerans]|nr:SDR family oxidoreductase [Bosea psychrotolerans]
MPRSRASGRSASSSRPRPEMGAAPDDIAGAIAFLASPATKFITGQTLFVDGGKSLGGLGL